MKIETVERLDAAVSTHAKIPPYTGPQPAQGESFVNSEGLKVTRITDVLAPNGGPNFPKGWDGLPGSGLHNGYSLYSCVNRTGEYALAYGTTPLAMLYRLSDCKCLTVLRNKAGIAIGDSSEPRWTRRTDEPATIVYYHAGSFLYKQDALIGASTEQMIIDMGTSFVVGKDNGELSEDGRYGCYRLNTLPTGTTIVFDFFNKAVLPGKIVTTVSGVNVSPDGKWAKLMEPYTPGRYYRISDLAAGNVSNPTVRTDKAGHGAWVVDAAGNSVDLYQCNDDDWIKAFNPATGETIKIIYMGETGFGMNQHVARMNSNTKGWALISTYASDDSVWSYNQLFMLEIKPLVNAAGVSVPIADRPRIWRLGHTQGNYSGGYFTEAFASIDMAGQNIYWGDNWRGQDNIELYRLELPADWRTVLAGGAIPVPTPTPILPGAISVDEKSRIVIQSGTGIMIHNGPAQAHAELIPVATPNPTPDAPQTIYPTATNYAYASKNTLGDTTGAGYIMLASFAPESQETNANLVDTAILFQFDLSAIQGAKKATLVMVHHPLSEGGVHRTGREGIPVRRISGPPFTPVWLAFPDKTGSEAPFNGASYLNRIQTAAKTERWSTLTSKARPLFSRGTGDLTTVMEDITSDTPRLNFTPMGKTSSVDITKLVQGAQGGILQFALDGMNSNSPDRFGSTQHPEAVSCRAAQAFYGIAAVDIINRPFLKLEY